MHLPFIIFPLALVGFFVASEMIMSARSRWKELASRYRETSSPTLTWRGGNFLQTEIRQGNVIYRASYRGKRFSLWAQMFPTVSVAVDTRGLHFKRPPWNFMHPPLLIPWNAIAGIETMGAGEFGAGSLARQTGTSEQAMRARVPNAMSAVLQFAVGSVSTVTLLNPRMTLSVPASSIEGAERFLPRRDAQKPATPFASSAAEDTRLKPGLVRS